MLYPSGMVVARPAADGTGALSYTKHYFAGSQRVSSKIGTTNNLGQFLQEWTLQENSSGGAAINLVATSQAQLIKAQTGVTHVYTAFGITPSPTFNSNTAFVPVASFTGETSEVEQYYFHPDHLGSSNYITNLAGEVSQHTEYFAFGETFVEEHKNSINSPYKFNGKELDEESGLYYYGARYYDPRISIWASVDKPLIDGKYLGFEHDGGVLNSFNLNSYAYCRQSPVVLFDPDGNQYNSSIILNQITENRVTLYSRAAVSYTVTYNRFTPSTSHLLSLVSGVNESNIKSAKVGFSTFGGAGASITLGSSPSSATITHFYSDTDSYKATNGASFYDFLKRNAHEVGHIPQLENGNVAHVVTSLLEYGANIIDGQDWHDGWNSTKEPEADVGENKFEDFNNFIEKFYGSKKDKNVLEKLYKNKNNTQKDIIERINQWWKKFNESKDDRKTKN